MKTAVRRAELLRALISADGPIAGGELAKRFSVTRQSIISDITALRNDGNDIVSTHYGYVLKRTAFSERVFKLRHTTNHTEDELSTIVSLGGKIKDVFVWHKVYGKITAPLNIFTLDEVAKFISGVRSGKSSELMNVTDGYHYHTVLADSEETLDCISASLLEKGYLVPED